MYKFAAASEDEPIVFGSTRPGYTDADSPANQQSLLSKKLGAILPKL
jgi:hypothetical protein